MKADGNLDIINIGQLYRILDGGSPRRGKTEQSNLDILEDAAVSIRNGRIASVCKSSDIKLSNEVPVLDVRGAAVAPGFVESHAHPIYAGNRSHEYTKRLQGLPASILSDDEESGIKFSVRETRNASDEDLLQFVLKYLDAALDSGVTTCEVKAGYGLTLEEELRHLKIAKKAADTHQIRVQATFAAGHDTPAEVDAEKHIDDIVNVMLPRVVKEFPNARNDITCETGIFTVAQVEKVMHAATENGLKNIIHADAFQDSDGWDVAVRMKALSAHHLTYTSNDAIYQNRNSQTVATLLPVAELVYMTDRRAPARTFIDNNVPVAIATDFCSSIGATSLMRTMLLAAPWFSLDPAEALVATTLNAAYGLGVSDECGSVDIGKSGDFVIFDAKNLDDVFWSEPANPMVVRAGKIVRKNVK